MSAQINHSATYHKRNLATNVISLLVAVNGIYIIASTLIVQITLHHGSHLGDLQVDFALLIGVSVLYLSTLLARRKRTAWLVTTFAYSLYLILGLVQLLSHAGDSNTHLHGRVLLRLVVFPVILLILLLVYQHLFVVRSDIRGFRTAARFSIAILLVAFIYGVVGFQLLDTSDFHQEINWAAGAHYTIDQFDITTNKPVVPYTRRAHLFLDSLSFISFAAVAYALIALFQPFRSRFGDQANSRELMEKLLTRYGAPSEEFFKLWPLDKQYFFDPSGQSGLAFHAHHGVALCVSDPAGDPMKFPHLVSAFEEMCFHNDWLPSFIHVSDQYRELYEDHGYILQKLGEEAVVDLAHFQSKVMPNKYFRQINNRFEKQGYKVEFLKPPHHQAVLDRLEVISQDWLSQGGRSERGFAMGYYSAEYMQMCQVMVARDAADTIQAFLNLVPAGFDKEEATYDLLRHASGSMGNINDYLLISLINVLHNQGYSRLNLGLSPLVGLKDTPDEKRTLINNVLQFAYANGDRFYSFSGLHRFKAKYEPVWQDKYVAYQDGMRGFSRTMTALTRCMRSVVKRP